MTAPRILARDVLRTAAVVFDLPVETLIGRQRDFAVTRPRALACRAIRTLCPHISYPEIGRMLGRRDHTTIIKNIAKTPALLASEPDLAAAYDRLLRDAAVPQIAALDAEIADGERRLAALFERRAALLSADTLAQTGV